MTTKLLSLLLLSILVFPFKSTKELSDKSRPDMRKNGYGSLSYCSSGFDFSYEGIDTTDIPAPLFDNMGNHSYPVHSISKEAQKYFDQGLKLIWGFNHAEAYRSFSEVSKLDPGCAMAYWGMAMAQGPNLNDQNPSSTREQEAFEKLQKARKLASGNDKEYNLISALAFRHTDTVSLDRQILNRSYAKAMKELSSKYPDDLEIQTLTADAIMNTMPWDYYINPGEAKEEARVATKILENVLKINPNHPGAHHLYIHIVEASDNPDRGIKSAEKLGSLVPAAGHLVHMPAHIFARVGRYQDAVVSNQKAILADEEYLSACQAQGTYPLGYYPHNIHFLWMAATMSGQKEEALDAAEKVADKIPIDAASEDFVSQVWMPVPLQAYVRFGLWNQILTTPEPSPDLHIYKLYWHHARVIAFAKKNIIPKAQVELELLQDLLKTELDSLNSSEISDTVWHQMQVDMTHLLALIPEATFMMATGEGEKGIDLLKKAVKNEDNLPYNEPPNWHHPVRQVLGNALLNYGDYKAAEKVFREDLLKNRENGWSLWGLYLSLKNQGKAEEATIVRKRFNNAWKNADVDIEKLAL